MLKHNLLGGEGEADGFRFHGPRHRLKLVDLEGPADAVSWEISFSATGMPIAFAASDRKVSSPVVTSIRPSSIPHRYMTRNLVTGQDKHATLTSGGRQLVALLTDDFPITPKESGAAGQASPKD